jgi:hypothetical protein
MNIHTLQSYCSIICILFTIVLIAIPIQSSNTFHYVTIDVHEVRYLDPIENMDAFFTFTLNINDEWTDIVTWNDFPYVLEPEFSRTIYLSGDEKNVTINMMLELTDGSGTYLCDLTGSNQERSSATMVYDMNTGHWTGDDYRSDPSGYGRLNGCDDGSIYESEYDSELWFSITQHDPDGDGIPTWVEENIYGTDPYADNRGEDPDSDGVPIEWEWKWGYDPFVWEDHENLDPDGDSLNNIEEYLVSSFGSDPFRKDIFLELDWMDEGPNNEKSMFPDLSIQLLKNPFHRRNYVFHVDTGFLGGGDLIPFDESVDSNDLLKIYNEFFMNNGTNAWKRGIFHYGIYVYDCFPKGYAFSGDVFPHWGYHPGTNGFMISSKRMERNGRLFQPNLEYFYAAATMHEMGHNFGFRWGDPYGVDAQLGKYPWQPMYYVYRNYKSIMNYRYTYKIFDYSDGSNGFLDNDDWGTLDLSYFEYP